MLCFSNLKKSLFVSLLFSFLVLSFSLVSNVADSFATTVSETYNAPSTSTQVVKFSDIGSLPDISQLDSSKIWSYSITFNVTQRYNYNTVSFGYNNNWYPCFTMSSGSYPRVVSCLYYDYSIDSVPYRSFYNFSNISIFNSYQLLVSDYYSSFTLSVSDETSSSSPSGNIDITENGTYDVTNYASATVNIENEVIYGDYHNDLININNSILICGAICLVLYFFYSIYRMIIKSTGGS